MDIAQLVKKSSLYPILILESLLSSRVRSLFVKISGGLFILLAILATFFSLAGLSALAPKVWGLIFISLAFYAVGKMLEFYFNSSYYFDSIALNNYQPGDIFTFTVGRVLLGVRDNDVLAGFLESAIGQKIIKRCGLSRETTANFLAKRGAGVFYKLPLNPDQVLKLRDLVKFLFENDSAFAGWLAEAGITEVELLGATAWVVYEIEYWEYRKRWWREDNLTKIPGLAKDWGFGNTFNLDKYSSDLLFGLSTSNIDYEFSARTEEMTQIENVLAKQKEANIFIVADSTSEQMDVVWHLARRFLDGTVPPALEHKRPVLFKTTVFLSQFKDKASLEAELLKILTEASQAGNILLVFDNFAGLIQEATAFGADLVGLLYPFLSSSAIQIIGLANNDDFHHNLESNATLMTTFDRIFIRPLPEESIIRNLEQTVWQIEAKNRLFFTYPAMLEIARDANRYFTESDSGDKAVDLLVELVPWARSRKVKVIGQSEVEEMIGAKTGVPIGELKPAERENLMALEQNLHGRVIGQEEAISAVSNALRRSRAGVRNAERPIGSFLFLGPTGVGKTETSKALAQIMFGEENKMSRLDMSEYQTPDAVGKLIGSFSTGQPGLLADLVRENPYGVLLLDEFEKTNPDVLDIFLQILDEGFFSDKSGKRVSLRNLIIIATSNAGADLIWQMVKAGVKPQDKVNELIDNVVQKGTFKPELLNRFDAVVVFHPLQPTELEQIANLMLLKLAKRLETQGVTLEIGEVLIKSVAQLGANEVFGARPMQRFIQDNVEQQVADAIIKGTIKSGSIVDFTITNNRPELTVKKL